VAAGLTRRYDGSMPSRRKVLKWGGRVVAGLFVLALLALVGADRWRAWRMSGYRERIEAAQARVDDEVLKGKTPSEWHLSRATGTNGWPHIAFVDDARRAESGDTLTEALDSLGAYQQGAVDSEVRQSDGQPGHEILEEWLRESQPFADAYARAASADCIVMVPAADEYYPQLNGVPVIHRISETRTLLGRVKALLAIGKAEQAASELDTCIRAQCLLRAPTSIIDAMTMHARVKASIEAATEFIIDQSLAPAQAKPLLKYRANHPPDALAAIEAEIVWLYSLIHEAAFLTAAPAWFDWLGDNVPRGKGMFADEEFYSSASRRWAAPLNLSKESAGGLEILLDRRDTLGGRATAIEAEWPETDDELLFWIFPPEFYRNQLLLFELAWLELELRILEAEVGPLAANRERVAELLGRYPKAEHEFDGQDLLIRLAADLVVENVADSGERRLEPATLIRDAMGSDD
jgi:hypothetical protein